MSSAPSRFINGMTQAGKFQPFGELGIPDPFYYAVYEDDFLPYAASNYTVTATGGSVAASAAGGAGGRILMTTGAVITNFASLQQAAASFSAVNGTKLAYLCRIQMTDVTNSVLTAGLIQTTATPGTITNGIVITKAAASTNIVVSVISASTTIATTTISGLLTNGQDIDLGFLMDRSGNIQVHAGNSLVGNKSRQNVATLGPRGKILATAITAYPVGLLNPTIAVTAGTGALQTMYVDFMAAGQER